MMAKHGQAGAAAIGTKLPGLPGLPPVVKPRLMIKFETKATTTATSLVFLASADLLDFFRVSNW